jgi:hypothetical protein
VALVRTDVSEELSTSIRVIRNGELETTQSSNETSALTIATRRNIPEDTILHCQDLFVSKLIGAELLCMYDVYSGHKYILCLFFYLRGCNGMN